MPYRARPIKNSGYDTCAQWACWLTDDQREASGRPDVVSFTTDVLTKPVEWSRLRELLDAAFGCVDLPMILEVDRTDARYLRRFVPGRSAAAA